MPFIAVAPCGLCGVDLRCQCISNVAHSEVEWQWRRRHLLLHVTQGGCQARPTRPGVCVVLLVPSASESTQLGVSFLLALLRLVVASFESESCSPEWHWQRNFHSLLGSSYDHHFGCQWHSHRDIPAPPGSDRCACSSPSRNSNTSLSSQSRSRCQCWHLHR